MKKLYSLLAAGLLLAAPGAARAMDQAALLADPGRYRVIYAGEDEVIYADMTSVRSIQTMDFPNSIENAHFKMYVESYKDKVDAMDFAKGGLVTQIREFDAGLYVNKNKKSYKLETKLDAVYDAAGAAIPAKDLEETGDAVKIRAKAEDLYKNLYRLERLPKAAPAEEVAPSQEAPAASSPETAPAPSATTGQAAASAEAPAPAAQTK